MALEINGKLVQVLPEQSGEGRNGTWTKQNFVIETDEQYPKKVCFTLWGERTQQLQTLTAGTMLKVSFDLESREWQGKWFTDAKAWRVDVVGASEGSATDVTNDGFAPASPKRGTMADDPFPSDLTNPDIANDLPF